MTNPVHVHVVKSTASMDQWKGRVALVTGASAGIGYDLSKQLAENFGMNVIGCARNIKQIEVSSQLMWVWGQVWRCTDIMDPSMCTVHRAIRHVPGWPAG